MNPYAPAQAVAVALVSVSAAVSPAMRRAGGKGPRDPRPGGWRARWQALIANEPTASTRPRRRRVRQRTEPDGGIAVRA